MTATADDLELLSRSAAGDREAFGGLIERHGAAVHRFLRSLGAAPDDAEDALQECFLSAWRHADTYRGGASARTWLFTIARNALSRQSRKRAGEPARLEPLDSLGAVAGWGSVCDFVHRFEAAEELRWALSQIPDDERQVVVLRDLEGLGGEEVAALLEVSLAAMKSRLHRGRLRLMGILRGGVDRA